MKYSSFAFLLFKLNRFKSSEKYESNKNKSKKSEPS